MVLMAKPKQPITDTGTQAEHHLTLRVRRGTRSFKFIDHVIVFSGPLIPLAVFFQAHGVWIEGEVAGLSIITWSLLLFSSSTMAVYAIYHRTLPLILTYIPLVLANTAVVLGILILG